MRGGSNPHGWGVAFYPDGGRAAFVVKEPCPSVRSPVAAFLRESDIVRSKIVVSHVRRMSAGRVVYSDTHPFVRELFGRDWVFAHNGTLNASALRVKFYEPVGETDSEKAFCVMLDRLRDVRRTRKTPREVIEKAAREISRLGDFNFLMSDGERLYAFWSGYSELYYVVRVPPHRGIVRLVDEDFEVNLGEMKEGDEVATIVATRPLTSEEWVKFPRQKLMVFRNGLLDLTSQQWKILGYIRRKPSRASIREVAEHLGVEPEEAAKDILELKEMELLKQDGRDRLPPGDPGATYYTNPGQAGKVRKAIDAMLGHVH